MGKQIFIVIIVSISLSYVAADKLWFMRNLTCIEITQTQFGKQECNRWNQSTSMYFYIDFFHLCFPEGTIVQTEKGPVALEELQVGDRVLSWNRQSKTIEFSSVVGWISRDAEALSRFSVIEDEDQQRYMLSPLHNIAVKSDDEEDGSHSFKFARSLEQGDLLVRPFGPSKSIRTVKYTGEMKGLYAPLTHNSNFFIYPYGTNNTSNKSQMVLVHCYSQIRKPIRYEKILTPLLSIISYLSFYHEDSYANPLFKNLRYFLQDDWQDQNHQIRYELSLLELREGSNNLRTSSPAKSVSKGSHSSHSSSSSNRRRARKKSAVKMFSLLSVMKNTIFNV